MTTADHALTSLVSVALCVMLKDDEPSVSRACLGFDVAEVRSAPVDHFVQVGIDLGYAQAARQHLVENGLRGFVELSVGLQDPAFANSDKLGVVFLAWPKDGLSDIVHVSCTPMVACTAIVAGRGGAASFSPEGASERPAASPAYFASLTPRSQPIERPDSAEAAA